jgi:hypothetical protein
MSTGTTRATVGAPSVNKSFDYVNGEYVTSTRFQRGTVRGWMLYEMAWAADDRSFREPGNLTQRVKFRFLTVLRSTRAPSRAGPATPRAMPYLVSRTRLANPSRRITTRPTTLSVLLRFIDTVVWFAAAARAVTDPSRRRSEFLLANRRHLL